MLSVLRTDRFKPSHTRQVDESGSIPRSRFSYWDEPQRLLRSKLIALRPPDTAASQFLARLRNSAFDQGTDRRDRNFPAFPEREAFELVSSKQFIKGGLADAEELFGAVRADHQRLLVAAVVGRRS